MRREPFERGLPADMRAEVEAALSLAQALRPLATVGAPSSYDQAYLAAQVRELMNLGVSDERMEEIGELLLCDPLRSPLTLWEIVEAERDRFDRRQEMARRALERVMGLSESQRSRLTVLRIYCEESTRNCLMGIVFNVREGRLLHLRSQTRLVTAAHEPARAVESWVAHHGAFLEWALGPDALWSKANCRHDPRPVRMDFGLISEAIDRRLVKVPVSAVM